MKVVSRASKSAGAAALCLMLAVANCVAQKPPTGSPAPGSANDTRRILVDKAHALDTRGRPDMAIQLWQQILLSDPGSTEALAGLARDYKLIGSEDKAAEALERLRAANPNDPNIAKIQALSSTRVQSDQLRQAGELARQGKADEAMRIYRSLYADRPPDGDIALAYYETLYGTATGKEQAMAAMRALAQRNPGDTRFSIELGRMLTYETKTRAEGMRVLKEYPNDPTAQAALRQALIWDASNPASAEELRSYLREHPQDTEISNHLKEDEGKLAQMNTGLARTPAEREAFAALSAHRLDEAQTRFSAILQQEPGNPRAAAGMGFLRMQQNNFGGAISYLTQAEQGGLGIRSVEDALVTSRFWFIMSEASQAFDENQLDQAESKYRDALAMRPHSREALSGLAGLMLKEQQFSSAAAVYDELLKVQPANAGAWRGLFICYARDGQNQKALDTAADFPGAVKDAMAKDPEYLRTLATIYRAQNRPADAQRVLAQALALPFPANGAGLKEDTRMQYAGILMEAGRFDQAAELYTAILTEDSANLSAWMGLVSAQHEMNRDRAAIAEVERMPPATYEMALSDTGFLSMLGSIYMQANQVEIAQGLLERAAKIQITAGRQPGIELQLQLANLYMQRNNTAQAYGIYHQVLVAHPDRVDAWKGLIATLQSTGHNSAAIDEIALIPPAVRKELEGDVEFVQTEASLYAASGNLARATEDMTRVENHYASLNLPMPAAVSIQDAWLLFNTRNDRSLYPALMRLGGRADLTAAQRETVQTIWANWSVRRATAAIQDGNSQRGVDILNATTQAFPDNLTVRRAVAGGYLSAGQARTALALFKTIPMEDAGAADYQGAIGASMAANDLPQAERWLRLALERFPSDSAILGLAARFEQARGNNQRAAEYWRASLAAMPQVSPAEKLAHVLDTPEQSGGVRRAATPADLERLMNPENEPFPRTAKLPPLPSYGPDPYGGYAPVVPSQPAHQQPRVQGQQSQWTPDPLSAPSSQPWTPASDSAGVSAYAAPVNTLGDYGRENSRLASRDLPPPARRFTGEQEIGGYRDSDASALYGGSAGNSYGVRSPAAPEQYAALSDPLAQTAPVPRGLNDTPVWIPGAASVPADSSTVAEWQPPADARRLSFAPGDDSPLPKAGERDAWIPGDRPAAAVPLPDAGLWTDSPTPSLAQAGDGPPTGEEKPVWVPRTVPTPSAGDYAAVASADPLFPSVASAQKRAPRRRERRASPAETPEMASLPPDREPVLKLRSSQAEPSPAETAANSIPVHAPQETPVGVPDVSPVPPLQPLAESPIPPHEADLPGAALTAAQAYDGSAVPLSEAGTKPGEPIQAAGARITPQPSEPVGSIAGNQPAQDFGASIRPLANAQVPIEGPGQFNSVQYTPSAQEAASGAYSAPRQQAATEGQVLPQESRQRPETADGPARKSKRSRNDTAQAEKREKTRNPQTLGMTPGMQGSPDLGLPGPQFPDAQLDGGGPSAQGPYQQAQDADTLPPAPTAQEGQPFGQSSRIGSMSGAPGGTGLSDQELEDRNLPPLRGPWVRVQREQAAANPHDEAEAQLEAIESGYSPWLGGAGVLNYRSGSLGYDHLSALESPFETSMPFGYDARLTVVAKPVFLDSGQADGTSVLSVNESTTAGTSLVTIPQPIGTDVNTGPSASSTATTLPAQQNAAGIGGEAQLVFPHLALAAGYTPSGFLVGNVIGRANWRPGNGPFTFNFSRDSIKDSQLSYAGLRDPAGDSLGREGQIWGAAIANQGNVQYSRGDAESGFYVGAGGQYITGTHVETNSRFDASGGSYWRILSMPEYGNLSIGANFFAMHYANNQLAYTHGMGGYFSPQAYFLANVPFTWNAHQGKRWHYNILGSLGVQAFQENSTPLWPLAEDKALEIGENNATLPAKTSVGPNYDLHAQTAYAISPNWYAGGFLGANNARNYSSVQVGFYVRYLFRQQPSLAQGPTGLFPTDGLRPFRVP